MKCNRIAIYGWKSKKSKNKNKPVTLGSFKNLDDAYVYAANNGELFDHLANQCQGDIISNIELEYIPYFGGESANIEVRFKCNRCGFEFADDLGLPYDVDSLNKFLTKVISEM